MNFKSDFLKEFQNRGYFNQTTHEDQLDELLSKEKITAYIGFDCTAKTLHLGSLIQIMILRLLQKNGHTPIVLLGGGTTKVGDPSGKDESRPLLTDELIEENIQGIKKTLEKFDLSKTNPDLPEFKFVNNDDWLKNLNYIDLLRDFGNHFTINRMLTFDSVKLRLDRQQPLTFLEFNYMIFQAYDFYKLNSTHSCILQIGGSDQWGNIVNGVELTRRYAAKDFAELALSPFKKLVKEYPLNQDLVNLLEINNKFYELVRSNINKEKSLQNQKEISLKEKQIIKSIYSTNDDTLIKNVENARSNIKKLKEEIDKSRNVFGLTTPLLTTSDGKKMGKTANGAVWLDQEMLDPFEYFQYFRNVDDKDVSRFLKLFTEFPLNKIEEIQKQDINEQKQTLAFEVTKICHGEEIAKKCLIKAQKIFSSKGDNIDDLPQIKVQLGQDGKMLTSILKEENLCASIGEARRLVKGGGVKINNEKINDETYLVKFNNEIEYFKLQLGKKKFFKVNINL